MEPSISIWSSSVFRQVRVMSALHFNKFGHGMVMGLPSVMITALLSPTSNFKINMDTASWIGPINTMSSVFSLPIASYLMNKIGRRRTYIILNMPAIIGLVFDSLAYNVPILLLGRLLSGVTLCTTGSLSAMIIGEFAGPQHRGMFLMLNMSFFNVGMLFVHFLGYYMDWRNVCFAVAVPFVTSALIAISWPESPYWLSENKKINESEEVFFWLRGITPESAREFDEMVKKQRNRDIELKFSEKFSGFFKKFKKRNFWKPFLICMITPILMECSGRHFLPVYAGVIIGKITSSATEIFRYNMALDILICVSAIASSYFIRKFKLRKLLFSTGSLAVVILYLSSLALLFLSNGTLSVEYSFVPVILLGLFFVLVNLCCTLLPMTIGGEIFPLEHRAVGTSVVGYFISIYAVVTLKITPTLLEHLKIYGTFIFFASGLVLVLTALFFMLPETKSKTLDEIDDFFTYGKNKNRVQDKDRYEAESISLNK